MADPLILVNPNNCQPFVNDFIHLQKKYKDFKTIEFEEEEPLSKDRVPGYALKKQILHTRDLQIKKIQYSFQSSQVP